MTPEEMEERIKLWKLSGYEVTLQHDRTSYRPEGAFRIFIQEVVSEAEAHVLAYYESALDDLYELVKVYDNADRFMGPSPRLCEPPLPFEVRL
jgi:hypothetical protein